jgi:DNA-binding response OmpR family regulator
MSWVLLCVSDDTGSLLLYQSMLAMEGHTVLVAPNADEALRAGDGIAIDCVVIDCEDNGVAVTREIATARLGIPIIFVSDQSEVQMQIYSETGMFISKEEAIEQLSRCVGEVLKGNVYRSSKGSRRKSTGASTIKSLVFHRAWVRWFLPWLSK